MREYSLDQVNIPRMYFQEQSADFTNKRNYLSLDYKRITQAETEEVNPGPAQTTAPKRSVDTPHDSSKRLKTA